ncbi:hypothetical protein SAMN04488688_11076 [Paenibacillus sp. cl141a]|uniref:hypothetical protein n=1 Tax=Paenibacillus sp. cl141a TaxID=1761877 RepID=UPI0008C31027|nr:hypothetical protein [Paenibacillus sp. cl141a]SEM22967.1 hypothetical protein SAMN04488688_11076 [Paenibacillus sp. cl141a]
MTRHSHYYHRRPTNNHRSLNSYESLPQDPTPYPGITPYGDYPEVGETALYPYTDGVTDLEASASALAPSSNSGGGGLAGLLGGGGGSGGGLSKLLGGLGVNNMSDIKGLIDRMGGIDGIVNNIGKVQKVMQGFQQLAPMFSVLAGALKKKGSGSSSTAYTDQNEDGYEYRPRRRRSSGSRRRSGSRKSSSSKRRRR